MNYSRSVTFPFGLTGSVNYRENASIADHAMRISGGRKDNSQPLLFQVCAVFSLNTAHIARYYFGVAELIVTFVGVDVVADGHFGSWMIFVSLCHSFCEVEKGL